MKFWPTVNEMLMSLVHEGDVVDVEEVVVVSMTDILLLDECMYFMSFVLIM
jgi:hypothetical protein